MNDLLNIIFDQLKFISIFGDSIVLIILSFVIVLAFLLSHKHYKTAFVTILTSGSYLYSAYLKWLFKEQRPLSATSFHFSMLDKYSFPSTHVVFYTVFWGFIVYLTYKYAKEAKLLLHATRWLAIYYIIAVGASRIALGAHFLQDVVAGYIFGFIFLYLLIWLDKELRKKFSKN